MKLNLIRRLLGSVLGSAVLATAALSPVTALAGASSPFTDLVFFGDSLSDTGNLFLATGGTQPPAAGGPYFNGRFSDGPLWVERLASGLGQANDAAPYLLGGNNYAYAGARSSTSSAPPGLLAQIGGIWGATHAAADPGALYVVVAGGNDLRDARTAFPTNSAADEAGRQKAANDTAVNLISGLGLLAQKGARNVLIANLPDLGATPEASFLGLTAPSSDVSARFNALLPVIAGVGAQTFGLNVSFLDMASLGAAVRDDALTNGGAVYGITNVALPCAGFFGAGPTPTACSASLFSDALHPSARAHQLLGDAALLAVGVVPEPASALLMALGVAGVLVMRRRAA
jgi:outer membrane lipase/esterase